MAIQTMDNPIDSKISLNRPIPGSSLTSDPDSPAPWEKPPEFVNLEESLKYLLDIIYKYMLIWDLQEYINDSIQKSIHTFL